MRRAAFFLFGVWLSALGNVAYAENGEAPAPPDPCDVRLDALEDTVRILARKLELANHLDGTVNMMAVREYSRSGLGWLVQAGMMVHDKVQVVARYNQLSRVQSAGGLRLLVCERCGEGTARRADAARRLVLTA